MYVFKLFAKLRQIFGMCKSLGHNLAHDVDARYEVLYGGAYLYAGGVVYCMFFRKKIKKAIFATIQPRNPTEATRSARAGARRKKTPLLADICE